MTFVNRPLSVPFFPITKIPGTFITGMNLLYSVSPNAWVLVTGKDIFSSTPLSVETNLVSLCSSQAPHVAVSRSVMTLAREVNPDESKGLCTKETLKCSVHRQVSEERRQILLFVIRQESK